MVLQRNTHHVFRLMYHFVWIPKYRHKVFSEPYRSELKAIIQKIGYDYNIDIVELEVPIDHIHMVVRSEPKTSPSKVMQVIKSISAREFFKLHPEIRKQYFWGGKLWTVSALKSAPISAQYPGGHSRAIAPQFSLTYPLRQCG